MLAAHRSARRRAGAAAVAIVALAAVPALADDPPKNPPSITSKKVNDRIAALNRKCGTKTLFVNPGTGRRTDRLKGGSMRAVVRRVSDSERRWRVSWKLGKSMRICAVAVIERDKGTYFPSPRRFRTPVGHWDDPYPYGQSIQSTLGAFHLWVRPRR